MAHSGTAQLASCHAIGSSRAAQAAAQWSFGLYWPLMSLLEAMPPVTHMRAANCDLMLHQSVPVCCVLCYCDCCAGIGSQSIAGAVCHVERGQCAATTT